jgi:hypothetical protein
MLAVAKQKSASAFSPSDQRPTRESRVIVVTLAFRPSLPGDCDEQVRGCWVVDLLLGKS